MNKFEDVLSSLCRQLNDTLIQKNRDYKNSYVDTVEKYGDIVPLIRLNDKFSRLEQLILTDEKHVNESVEDTLLDLAGYCMLELARRNLAS